jgi:TolB-like protein
MSRSTAFSTRLLAATLCCSATQLGAQADTRPVVVVYTFTNSAIGAKSDFEGISTGIQDLLITDLASSAKFRIVDRSRIADLLQEQGLVRSGQIDPQTAVRLGRILGAQYAITGGFMAQGGTATMTSRTIDIETTQIGNPERINGKPDDVLGMITQLSSKISANLNLAPKRAPSGSGGEKTSGSATGSAGSAGSAGAPSSAASKSAPLPPPAASSAARPANSETFAKQIPATVVEKTMKTKLDAATMKIYSRALDEMDAKNSAKATELFRQVIAKYPDFEPARRNLDKLSSRSGN